MAQVFISYTRRSESVTKRLVDDVEALDQTVWFDQELSGGQVWWDRILAVIRECDVFLFVLDRESLSSTACKREYGYAADLGKTILPVLVAEDVSTTILPAALSQIQFVDYRKRDGDAVLNLAKAFRTLPPPRPLPDPLPSPPDAPLSYLGSVAERIDAARPLTYEQQSALVLDLRRSLRDASTRADALTLLHRLRSREDLLASIDRELDEIIRTATTEAAPPPQAPHVPQLPQTPNVREPRFVEEPVPVPPVKQVSQAAVLVSAAVGLVLGTAILAFAADATGDSMRTDIGFLTLFGGVPWAIAGAISARRSDVITLALAFGIVGFGLAFMIGATPRTPLVTGLGLGASPGLILGATIGAVRNWKKTRHLTQPT